MQQKLALQQKMKCCSAAATNADEFVYSYIYNGYTNSSAFMCYIYIYSFANMCRERHTTYYLWLYLKIRDNTVGNVLPIKPRITDYIMDRNSISTLTCVPYNFVKTIHIIGKHSRARHVVKWTRVFNSLSSLDWCIFILVDVIVCTLFTEM